MIDTDQYWHGVAEKFFALSSQMGPPTFFLTLTMNPYLPEYQALKRGTGHFSNSTLISIVFRARRKDLMKFCTQSQVLGKAKASVAHRISTKKSTTYPYSLLDGL
jgi:hypothetical protein